MKQPVRPLENPLVPEQLKIFLRKNAVSNPGSTYERLLTDNRMNPVWERFAAEKLDAGRMIKFVQACCWANFVTAERRASRVSKQLLKLLKPCIEYLQKHKETLASDLTLGGSCDIIILEGTEITVPCQLETCIATLNELADTHRKRARPSTLYASPSRKIHGPQARRIRLQNDISEIFRRFLGNPCDELTTDTVSTLLSLPADSALTSETLGRTARRAKRTIRR